MTNPPITEQAGPQLPRQFPELTVVKLRYTRTKNVSLFSDDADPEVQIWFQIGDDKATIVVPNRVIDHQRGIIVGTIRSWNESKDLITIRFPPTNWGTDHLSGSREHILAIAEPFDDGVYTRQIADPDTAVENI